LREAVLGEVQQLVGEVLEVLELEPDYPLPLELLTP
jgi:hypothetical protein